MLSLFTAATLMIAAVEVRAEGPPRVDQKLAASIKAAYLSKLADFTTWPESAMGEAGSPIGITVLGKDPFGVATLLRDAIRQKKLTSQGRPLVVHRIGSTPDMNIEEQRTAFAAALNGCHILFVTDLESDRWNDLKRLLANRPILTVGEFEGCAASGGMIEFVIAGRGKDGKDLGIDMHINLDAVKRADLRLNSRLLSLRWVRIVREAAGAAPPPSPAVRPDARVQRLTPTGGEEVAS